MNLLLDTNALLRWLNAPEELAGDARRRIADPSNDVYVSAVAAWEIAVKVGLGKLAVPPDVRSWLPDRLNADRFLPLPITLEHALGVEQLALHHRDPFDRLLIAQGIVEEMTIVTRDRVFDRYAVHLMHC